MQKHSVREAQLMNLGMTRYEAAVYATLLGRGRFSATEVATRAGVPRQRVYDVLETLAAHGLCVRRIGKGKHTYSAVDPRQALAGLVEQYRGQQDQEIRRRSVALREILPELIHLYASSSKEDAPIECLEVLTERHQVMALIRSLTLAAEREILTFARKPLVGSREENIANVRDVIGRIKPLSLFQDSDADDAEFFDMIHAFAAMGVDTRFVPRIPLKGKLFDERKAVIILEEPAEAEPVVTGLFIEHPNLVKTLKLSFQSLWADGLDFNAFCRRRGIAASRP